MLIIIISLVSYCSCDVVGASLSEPHINVKFVRLICLSVCPYVHDMKKYIRIVVIYGVPLVVDSSIYGAFGKLLYMPTFNKHVATKTKTNRFLYLRKQVYGLLIKIISLALLLLSTLSAY